MVIVEVLCFKGVFFCDVWEFVGKILIVLLFFNKLIGCFKVLGFGFLWFIGNVFKDVKNLLIYLFLNNFFLVI